MWGKNIRVVILPSILAITYISQSRYIFIWWVDFNFLPLATWLTSVGATSWEIGQVPWQLGQISYAPWGITLILIGLASSMAVNTLVTGLIVFKILKTFLGAEAISDSTRNTKLRQIIFIIIESGMALFAIQLVRLVLAILATQPGSDSESQNTPNVNVVSLFAGIQKMFNVIIRSVRFYFFCFYW